MSAADAPGGVDRRRGLDRRSDGRVVYSRGPIIRTLEVLSAFTGIVAIASLVLALVAFSHGLADIQTSRERAAEDSCHLIRGLVLEATPRHRLAAAITYLDRSPLANCHRYGAQVRQ